MYDELAVAEVYTEVVEEGRGEEDRKEVCRIVLADKYGGAESGSFFK